MKRHTVSIHPQASQPPPYIVSMGAKYSRIPRTIPITVFVATFGEDICVFAAASDARGRTAIMPIFSDSTKALMSREASAIVSEAAKWEGEEGWGRANYLLSIAELS